MATQTVVLLSLVPVMCSAGEPLGTGGLVSLSLNTAADPDLPISINGIVQPTLESRVKMIGPDSCPVVGYRYVVAYESDDLNGAMESLTADMVVEFRCVTCCEVIEQKLAEMLPVVLDSPPASSEEYPPIRISGDIIDELGNPVTFPDLIFADIYNGLPRYTETGVVVGSQYRLLMQVPQVVWILTSLAGIWAADATNTERPDQATGWIPDGGSAGTPIVTSLPPGGSPGFFGQRAYVGVNDPNPEVYECVRETPVKWVKLSN